MAGRPVWLASVSLRAVGKIKGTYAWGSARMRRAEFIAHQMLKGVGDPERERAFRMNVTFCIHRALTEEEEQELPDEWEGAPGGLAGPPVEILWSRGIPHTLAAMPCMEPRRVYVVKDRPDLWVPEGCGECKVCLAREASRAN